MRTRSTAILLLLIPCLAAVLYADANASAAQSKSKNALTPRGIETVPLENRARLLERVKAYVKAEHNRDWAAQYDLKAPEVSGSESKQAFVARFRKIEKDGDLSQLLDFEITDIMATVTFSRSPQLAGSWTVSGCAAYHDLYMLGNSSYESSMEVRLRENEWFVAGMGPDSVIDGDPTGCHFHKKRSILAKK